MAIYDRYINSNPAIGNDSNDGSQSSPWLTLNRANNLTVGSNIYRFHLVNNCWDYPYRATGADVAALAPTYGSTASETTKFQWFCNRAVITGTARLTGVTWTRLPGSSYVYYCNPGWSVTPNVIVALNTDIHWIGEAIWLQKLADIPSNSQDHCWYWDANTGLLYFCDQSGNPNTTGVILEYGDKDNAIYASSKGNHQIFDARVFPGKLRCVYWNGPYNGFYRNKIFYGGSSALVKVEGSTFKDTTLAYNLFYGTYQAYSYGLLHLNGNGTSGLPNKIFQNTFYSGNRAVYLDTNSGSTQAYLFRNNLFFDQYTATFSIQTGGVIDEDYNVFGVSGNETTSLTLGKTTGAHSIPAAAITSTTNVGIPCPERSFGLNRLSVSRSTGAGLTGDYLDQDLEKRKVIGARDVGAYKFVISSRKIALGQNNFNGELALKNRFSRSGRYYS